MTAFKTNKPIFIEVTELRAIGTDPGFCWQLHKRARKVNKTTGEPTGGYGGWRSYRYFNEYHQAAKSLESELIQGCGARSFTELTRSAELIHNMLLEIHEKARIL